MDDELDKEMGQEENDFMDSTEYAELLLRFDQDGVFGSYLKEHAGMIRHYLGYRNPRNRMVGLLAHQSAILAGINRGISRILLVMIIFTAIVGYAVYKVVL